MPMPMPLGENSLNYRECTVYLRSKLVTMGTGELNLTVFDSICPLRGYIPYLAEIYSNSFKGKKLSFGKIPGWFSDLNTVVAPFKVESFWSKSRSRPHRVYLN